MNKQNLIKLLYDIEAIKLGKFTLKSGVESSVYIDLRQIISFPYILRAVAHEIWTTSQPNTHDLLCGVPYTALPIATCLSLQHNKPMALCRKEQKDYGTKKRVEGAFSEGQNCLVIEDVITSGGSVLESANALKAEGLVVTDIAVLMDREQGGRENLEAQGYQVHSVYTLTEFLQQLKLQMQLNQEEIQAIEAAL